MEEFLEEMEEKGDNKAESSLKKTNQKILVNSARKIVKNARKHFSNKKPKKLKTSDPLEKRDEDVVPVAEEKPLRQVPKVEKIVLVPRDPRNTIKIISLPPRLPPRATVTPNQKISFSVPTELVPSTSRAPHVNAPIKRITPFGPPTASSSSSSNYYADLRLKWIATLASRDQKKLTKGPRKKYVPSILKKVRKISEDDAIESLGEDEEISKALEPESFPKAIFYPDEASDEKKLTSKKPLTFSKVFEETTTKHTIIVEKSRKFKVWMKKSNVTENLNVEEVTEVNATDFVVKEPKIPEKDLFEVIVEEPAALVQEKNTEEEAPKENNYLICQNLLASDTDKAVPVVHDLQKDENDSSEEDEHQFEAVTDDSQSHQQNQIGGFSTFPLRPEINCMLMENIAYYRVIAQYLLKMKNIPAFDFENADNSELINIYRSLKRN